MAKDLWDEFNISLYAISYLNTVSLREFWLHGFEHLIGDYYPVLLELAHVSIIFFILLYCYRKRVFLKV